ncbi:MAG: hypothetical protein AAF957_01595 [Planctomycetota bacterium]
MSLLNTSLTRAAATAGLASIAIGVSPLAGETLSTAYSTDRSFAVSVSQTTSSETSREIYIDGEPREGRGGMGGGARSATFAYSYTDTPLKVKDGAPSKVERTFDEIGGSMSMERRGEPFEQSVESALEGITVVFTESGDGVEYEVTDGDAPDDEARLEGHRLALPLDALLPDDEVETGATWDIDGESLGAALGLGLERKLVDRPERPDGGQGREGRGGGGGRRQRGGMRGGGGGLSALASGEWSATATLTDQVEEAGGVECVVIKIEAEVEGSMDRSGGRDRDDFSATPASASAPQETSFSGEFEGSLLWCVAEKRPIRFSLEGTFQSSMEMERETQRGLMQMASETETKLEYTVEIDVQRAGSDD